MSAGKRLPSAVSLAFKDIDIIKVNGRQTWSTRSRSALAVLPCSEPIAVIEMSYRDLTICLKVSPNDYVKGVKIGAIAFSLLSLIQSRNPSYLFSYEEKDSYALTITHMDAAVWRGIIRDLRLMDRQGITDDHAP